MKKTSASRDKTFARGGHGPKQTMFGKGDRTRTAPADAANQQSPGQTAQHAKQARLPQERVDVAGSAGGTGGVSRPRRPA
jgi:hypothetical protein